MAYTEFQQRVILVGLANELLKTKYPTFDDLDDSLNQFGMMLVAEPIYSAMLQETMDFQALMHQSISIIDDAISLLGEYSNTKLVDALKNRAATLQTDFYSKLESQTVRVSDGAIS